MTLREGAPQGRVPPCQVWWPQALWQWRHNGFSLSCDLLRPRDPRVIWLYRWGGPQRYSAKFDLHRHRGSGDTFLAVKELLLIYKAHVISCFHTRNFRPTKHFPQINFPLYTEISPWLITNVMGENLWNIRKKLLSFGPKTLTRTR